MESSLSTFSSSRKLSSTGVTFRNPLLLPSSSSSSCPTRRLHLGRRKGSLSIRATITREKKEEIVSLVRDQLENCYLLAGIKYEGMTVKQMETLRRTLPESVKVLVAKNTLVGKAIEGTPWEPLSPCMKGMNAWMFVHTEEIPLALKPFRTFQKETKLDERNDFVGGVFEGKFYSPRDFKALETMPSKAEVFASLLGSLQAPPTALVGTLQAPARDIVLCLKAYVQKLAKEEQETQNS